MERRPSEGVFVKKQIQTGKVREPSGHFSQAISMEAKGRLVFISGMTARRADGTIAGNMEHFDKIHKVRREYFKSPPPASTMVEVTKMVSPEYLIEINAIAVVQ